MTQCCQMHYFKLLTVSLILFFAEISNHHKNIQDCLPYQSNRRNSVLELWRRRKIKPRARDSTARAKKNEGKLLKWTANHTTRAGRWLPVDRPATWTKYRLPVRTELGQGVVSENNRNEKEKLFGAPSFSSSSSSLGMKINDQKYINGELLNLSWLEGKKAGLICWAL